MDNPVKLIKMMELFKISKEFTYLYSENVIIIFTVYISALFFDKTTCFYIRKAIIK